MRHGALLHRSPSVESLDMSKASDYEGLQAGIRRRKLPDIETWSNEYPDREYTIEIEISEFTCVCPKTGLPDFATIRIEYVPDRRCAELKSFKLYLTAYRDIGIFHEHAANRILDDFIRAVDPRRARIEARFNPRGGITTTVRREHERARRSRRKG